MAWAIRSVPSAWLNKHYLHISVVSYFPHLSSGDVDAKTEIKARVVEALKDRRPYRARDELRRFFNLSNVTVLDCNQILKECEQYAKSTDVALMIWKSMPKKQIKPNIYSVASLLKVFCSRGNLDSAMKLMYQLGEEVAVQPHIGFCSIFLNGCRSAHSAFYVEECLRYIRKKGLKEDELVCLELLKLVGKRKDLRAIKETWAQLVQVCKPASPSLLSYYSAIRSLSNANSVAEALFVLQDMLKLLARNEYDLFPVGKVGTLSCLNSEDMADSDSFKICIEEKMLENFQVEEVVTSKAQSDDSKSTSLPLSGANIEGPSIGASVEDGSSPSMKEEDPFSTDGSSPSTKGEEPFSTNETFFDQILGLIKLALANIEESELKDRIESKGIPTTVLDESNFNSARIVLRQSFNAIIWAAASKGEYQTAEKLFHQLGSSGLQPDVGSYNALLTAVVKEKGLEQGIQLVKRMEEHGVELNVNTFNPILSGFCKRLEVDKAEALLERMLRIGGSQRPTVLSFNIVLDCCGILDDTLRTLRVFSKMVEADIKPNGFLINTLVQTLGRVNFPLMQGTKDSQKELARRIQAIESYMDQSFLPHDGHTFNTVLAAFCTEGMVDTVLQRLEIAEGRVGGDGLPIVSTVTYNTAINACNIAKQWSAGINILERMQERGLKPDRETYNTFINGCASKKNITDAVHFLDEMQGKGLKPDMITYSTIVKACCSAGELDSAMAVLKEMEALGLPSEPASITTILHTASSKEFSRLDLVELLVEHMHQKKLQPSISICEHVVAAYMNSEQIEDAVEALRVLSTRMLPAGVQSAGQPQDMLQQIFLEDGPLVDESTQELLEDAMVKQGAVSESLLAARLSGLGNASMEEWDPEESRWAKRLRAQYMDALSSSRG